MDFLVRREERDHISGEGNEENILWREYFRNKSSKCVLRGLVLDEIEGRALRSDDASNSSLAQSGQQGLEAIHEAGVLHCDVKNTLNLMVSADNIIWIDFSLSKSITDMDRRTFAKKAAGEIRLWYWYFKGKRAGTDRTSVTHFK